jgi:TolB protein
VFTALYFAKPQDSYPVSDIFVVNADGSGLRQLTKNMGMNSNPRWISDGQEIMFKSTQQDTSEILITDSTGKNLRKLANFEAKDWDFWDFDLSPDGDKLAFVNNRDYKVLQPDGTIFTKSTRVSIAMIDNESVNKIFDITQGDDCGAGDFYWGTAWSPDGKYLAVSFGCAPDLGEIYLIDSSKTGKSISIYDALKLIPGQNGSRIIDGFGWSSDGSQIVFVDSISDDSGKTYKNLYAVNVKQDDRKVATALTSNSNTYFQYASPSWVNS